MRYLIAISALLLFLITCSLAGIIHVPGDQPSIQTGINAAVNGDTVLVADSTYYENINFMGKAIIVTSYFLVDMDSVHIDSTIINGSRPADLSKGSVVSFTSGEDTNSVLCGFTITGGSGSLYADWLKVGGGICLFSSGARIVNNKIISNAVIHNQVPGDVPIGGGIGVFPKTSTRKVIIEHNLIASNSLNGSNGGSGGGIFLVSGRIINNRIVQNTSGGQWYAFGGGIAATCDVNIVRTSVTIVGNSILNNEASSGNPEAGGIGGGVDVQFCNVFILDNRIDSNKVGGNHPEGGGGLRLSSCGPSQIRGNTFTYNSSSSSAGGMSGLGGGIEVFGTEDLIIQENRFQGNQAAGGGGISTALTQRTVISDNTFLDNHCLIGGGIYEVETNYSIIYANLMKRNTAGYYGGGIMVENCSPQIYNNLIVANKATFNGGGIYLGEETGQAQIINNTIVADSAGIYGGGICANNVSPIIMNTILWNNFAPNGTQIYTTGADTYVVYCDVQDMIWPGEGNRNVDPLFVPGDSLYRLEDTSDKSICLNGGIASIEIGGNLYRAPQTDFGGNPRPQPEETSPDMGAWESPVVNTLEKISDSQLPMSHVLFQNYPNPFNPVTTIEFSIPLSAFVSLKIYNLLGQEVAILVSDRLPAGYFKFKWNARGLASGVYIYKLEVMGHQEIRKMVFMK